MKKLFKWLLSLFKSNDEGLSNIKKIICKSDEKYLFKQTLLAEHEINVDKIRKEINIVQKEKKIICDLNNPINKVINQLGEEQKRIQEGNITLEDIKEYNDEDNLRRSLNGDYKWKSLFK